MDNHNPRLIERITLTPAERALMVEQAETARVELAGFITACKGGTSLQVVERMAEVMKNCMYIAMILQFKIAEQMDLMEEDNDV